jgi:hypothetical protein
MAHRQYSLVHAQHVLFSDGMSVEFLGRHELMFRRDKRSITLPVETYIARDGAPDGVVVHSAKQLVWSDGETLTSVEFEAIMHDLQDAAGPLFTKFRHA